MVEEFQERWAEPRWLAPNRVASLPDIGGVAGFLDHLVARLGRATSWLTLLLVLLVAGDVLFRYVWHVSSVAEQEFEWHVLAVIAMIGASYTLQQGRHLLSKLQSTRKTVDGCIAAVTDHYTDHVVHRVVITEVRQYVMGNCGKFT